VAADGREVGESDFVVGEGPVDSAFPVAITAGAKAGGYLVAFSSDVTVRARVLDGSGNVVAETGVSQRSGCSFPAASYRERANEYLVGWACGLPPSEADFRQEPQTHYVQRLSRSP